MDTCKTFFETSEPQPDDIAGTTKNIHFIVLYDVLFGVGWALLCIIFLTAVLARKVERTPMWIVSVAAWVIYSFANLMMVGLQALQWSHSPPLLDPKNCTKQCV